MTTNSSKLPPKNNVKFSINLSEEQKLAKSEILNHPFSFIHGQAGTGKTMLGIQIALDLFFKREVDNIVITRPTVSTENIGYLPGSLEEKMDPWIVPITSNISKLYNKPKVIEDMFSNKQIEIVSLMHFRGRTYQNSVCIVDEYQNLTMDQLAMCIGRAGVNSHMIFCGDEDQIDLKVKAKSAVKKVPKISNSKYVYSCKLEENHRHPALKEVLNLLYL